MHKVILAFGRMTPSKFTVMQRFARQSGFNDYAGSSKTGGQIQITFKSTPVEAKPVDPAILARIMKDRERKLNS
jgi:hypothetical protein